MNRKKRPFKLTSLFTTLTLLLGFFVVASIGAQPTLAYLFESTITIENVFEPTKVTCAIIEYDETGTSSFVDGVSTAKTNVTVKNTGTTSAYIRAAIVVTWQDNRGNILGRIPEEGVDYLIDIADDTGWSYNSEDGFYYYSGSVSPNAETGILINSCSPIAGKTPSGYSLNVEILGSAIQSNPASVAENNWGF